MSQPSPLDSVPATATAPACFARAFALCADKTRRNIVALADAPKSGAFASDGNYFGFDEAFFAISNWTSSFFTGMALLSAEASGDPHFLCQLQRLAAPYREKIFSHGMETMHDLGFLYSLYSIPLYQRTREADHRRTALQAAAELAKRFIPHGRYLRAWGRMDETATDYAGLAIIDCMMNLPLLFWAAGETGEPRFRAIATAHADTTQANFVRADASVRHACRFDLTTGTYTREDNYCGHAVGSHWARGTAWAIFGFALAYRHTGNTSYLATSRRIARRFLDLLDREVVPVWDFRVEGDVPRLRDSSAAAVAACGLLELSRFDSAEPAWGKTADRLLTRLCAPDYLDERPECPGVLKNGEVGDGLIDGTATYRSKNVYTSWGDYFFMEALSRRLHGHLGYW